jgi:hypothetical protein
VYGGKTPNLKIYKQKNPAPEHILTFIRIAPCRSPTLKKPYLKFTNKNFWGQHFFLPKDSFSKKHEGSTGVRPHNLKIKIKIYPAPLNIF